MYHSEILKGFHQQCLFLKSKKKLKPTKTKLFSWQTCKPPILAALGCGHSITTFAKSCQGGDSCQQTSAAKPSEFPLLLLQGSPTIALKSFFALELIGIQLLQEGRCQNATLFMDTPYTQIQN